MASNRVVRVKIEERVHLDPEVEVTPVCSVCEEEMESDCIQDDTNTGGEPRISVYVKPCKCKGEEAGE